jgi:ABC-type polysaccharide/polyol phosphate transport system ATPase subunit
MPAVVFDSVSKSYNLVHGRALLAQKLLELVGAGDKARQTFWALREISFRLERGASLALIGPNGAGKSTLLSLVAGLVEPDAGRVEVDGHVVGLLELGSGFHPDLSGEENLRLNAALLGLSRRETAARLASIIEFSGLREFIREPVRTYSSGMLMRLAFSVATSVEPDILLIDEIIAVGDQEFQARCVERIGAFRERGTTLVCVSHSPPTLRSLCDTALWLEHGRNQAYGPLDEVLAKYEHGRAAG